MDPADPCENPSWPSKDAGISNDDSQCTDGAQAVIGCAQVGTTCSPW